MVLKIKENRTIVLPIEEKNYDLFVNDLDTAHRVVEEYYSSNPEFFSKSMSKGYTFRACLGIFRTNYQRFRVFAKYEFNNKFRFLVFAFRT